MTRRAEWIFARVAAILIALVALITWLSFLPGCSVDTAGLDQPSSILARGKVDTGVTNEVTPSQSVDASADTSPVVTGIPDAGAINEGDGGAAGADVSPHTSDDSGTANPVADAGTTVPECPISATRSLSPCTATTQLCRYYDTGAPVLMSGCTAEGRLCVKTCN